MSIAASANRSQFSRLLLRLDDWCERIGDRLNPILIKETRQALKSRQFAITFSLLLFAALGWTIIGSLSMMPQIYSSPSAPRMLVGYYVTLALPMLLVVPLAAYRSLEGEIDDGTFELLSISILSPWTIVLGKLASAMLQMMLYFVALFPCVAYAYTLRGVDLPTTLLMVAILIVAGIVLTVVSLFLASLAGSRTGRVSTLLTLMAILFLAEWGVGALVITMILYGMPVSREISFFAVIATSLIAPALSHLMLTATAAQLTPESENRSTHLRLTLMALNAILFGLGTLAVQTLGPPSAGVVTIFAVFLILLWILCGSMMVAESPVITPRIRRELPSSFLSRCLLTWLTPGPATGLVFVTVNFCAVLAVTAWGLAYLSSQPGFFLGPPSDLYDFFLALAAYVVVFLIIVRGMIAVVRIKGHPRVEVGLAAFIVVLILTALIPYSIGLHLNDYRSYAYSNWQITNWTWTLYEILFRSRDMHVAVLIMATIAGAAFMCCLVTSPQIVLPRRSKMPERVEAELANRKHAAG